MHQVPAPNASNCCSSQTMHPCLNTPSPYKARGTHQTHSPPTLRTKLPLFGQGRPKTPPPPSLTPAVKDAAKHPHLQQYNSEFLGISGQPGINAGKPHSDPVMYETMAQSGDTPCPPHNDTTQAHYTKPITVTPLWKPSIPTAAKLLTTKFGKPDKKPHG